MRKFINVIYVIALIALLLLVYYSVLIYNAMQGYFSGYHDEEIIVLTIVAALSGAISFFLYRLKTKRKFRAFIKWFFFVLFFINTLTFEVIGVLDLFDSSYSEGLREYREIVLPLMKEVKSDDRATAEKAMMKYYNGGLRCYPLCYDDLESDFSAAVERWAEEGSDVAEFLMGEIYNSRYEYKENAEEHAFYWWSRAADHGNVNAYMRLAECYEGTIKVPTLYTNKRLAFGWWEKAAEGGSGRGYYEMGRIMAEYDNIEEAFYHWRKAAESGSASVCYDVGRAMAEYNNIEEAKYYWKKAADMGSEKAKDALQKVYSTEVQPGAKKKNPL